VLAVRGGVNRLLSNNGIEFMASAGTGLNIEQPGIDSGFGDFAGPAPTSASRSASSSASNAPELGKHLRVVSLSDGETLHNAFPDRSCKPEES
jgi:hypothetical protein